MKLILQTERSECGLACLVMIAHYYGFKTDLNSLRKKFSISSQGTSLKQIYAMASAIDFSGRALQVDVSELKQLKLPCIVHWDLNHFVVIKKVSAKKVVVLDPAVGEISYSVSDFSKSFTGVALELTPSEKFKKEEFTQKLTLRHFWDRLVGIKRFLSIVIVLSLVLQILAIISPLYMQTVVDDVLMRSDSSLLLVLSLGFLLLMFMGVFIETIRSFIVLKLSTSMNYQMAVNLFTHLIRLPVDYFSKRHMGDITSRFGSLGNVQGMITSSVVSSVLDGLMAIVTLAAMLIYSTKVSLVVIGFLVVYLSIRVATYRPFRRMNEEKIVVSANLSSNFMESIRAIQTIKLFQRENDRQNIWQNYLTDSMNISLKISKWGIGFGVVNKLLFGVENIVVVYLLATAVMNSEMSLGMLYAFMSYKGQFVSRVSSLVSLLISFKMIGLHLDRLADITFTEAEDVDRHSANLQSYPPVKGLIVVKNLTYRNSQTDDPVFENLSFSIQAGQSAAIVGPSGCGKTTLMKVMMGLLKAESGKVMIDGIDITKRDDYRTQIAAVMQDDQLLSGSVAENIACFDPKLDFERITQCAINAAVHEDIQKFGMQYQTLVGDMGTSLSGGQKQRVILARALYRNPRLLFLDEATSHLDIANESIVNSNIKQMDITRVLVAHRPETVKSADVVIDLGELKGGEN